MSQLGAAQVRKVPADTPDTARPSDAPAAAGAVAGVLIGYLLLANGVGYLRNPLRRKPWRPRSRRLRLKPADAVSGAGDGATDVSAAAWRSRRVAVGRLAVQLAGLGLVATRPTVPGPLLTRIPGGRAVVVWAGGRFIRPAGAGAARTARPAGPYRVRSPPCWSWRRR